MVKKCTKCREEKDLDLFRIQSSNKDGRHSWCKKCYNEVYSKNRHLSHSREYSGHRNMVYGFKENDEFVYIGETKNGGFRIWEHYNDKVKSFCKELSPFERQLKYKFHVLWYGDNDEYRKYQEKELIKLHKPKYNKTWVKES